jgi:hypothetical protein
VFYPGLVQAQYLGAQLRPITSIRNRPIHCNREREKHAARREGTALACREGNVSESGGASLPVFGRSSGQVNCCWFSPVQQILFRGYVRIHTYILFPPRTLTSFEIRPFLETRQEVRLLLVTPLLGIENRVIFATLPSSCRAPSLTRGRVCNLQCNHSLVRVAQDP